MDEQPLIAGAKQGNLDAFNQLVIHDQDMLTVWPTASWVMLMRLLTPPRTPFCGLIRR